MKKLLCLWMTAVLLLSMVSVSFYAADVDVAQTGNPYPTTQNVDGDGYYEVPCTRFAWQQAYDRLGISLPGWGNAVDWWQGAINAGYSTGSTPQPESIAVWSGDYYGHVAYVTSVSGGNTFTVNEGGRTDLDHTTSHGIAYGYTLTNAVGGSRPYDSGKTLLGFIYLNSVNPPQGHVMSESEGAGRTIPDGDYWICSRISPDYFLDISGDSIAENGSNVHMWVWSNVPGKYDAYHLTYLNNGFYQISQMNSNMGLDIEAGSMNRGANIHMWSNHSGTAHQWSIEKTDKGYKLRSRHNSYYMDVDNAAYSGGTNVKVWEGWDGDAQYFSFIPYSPNEKPLNNGMYMFSSSLDNSSFIDAPGEPDNFSGISNLQLWENAGEKLRIEYVGDGYYRIIEPISNLAVEVVDEAPYLNAKINVVLNVRGNSRRQLWKIKMTENGLCYIINKMSGYYLDVNGGNPKAGSNVQVYPYNGTSAQKWNPIRVIQEDMVTVEDVVIANKDSAVIPRITVKTDNSLLNKDSDYTVSVTADIASRKGTVSIKGINNYCNTITKTFSIELAEILGDADGNGTVNITDATIIQRYLTNLSVSYPKETLMNADVDGNGVLTIIDATLIQRHVTMIDTPYPIGKPKT